MSFKIIYLVNLECNLFLSIVWFSNLIQNVWPPAFELVVAPCSVASFLTCKYWARDFCVSDLSSIYCVHLIGIVIERRFLTILSSRTRWIWARPLSSCQFCVLFLFSVSCYSFVFWFNCVFYLKFWYKLAVISLTALVTPLFLPAGSSSTIKLMSGY